MSDTLPDGIHDFLGDTAWQGAEIAPLVGDASFRRYFRLRMGGRSAMLMHAPPPEEDPKPFLHVAKWLADHGMRAPAILAERADRGWILTEDFGDQRMKEWIDANPDDEHAVYAQAIDALVDLHKLPPGPFEPYDITVYQREAGLFVEWFCPAAGLTVDEDGWREAWDKALSPMLARQEPGVSVLRDYHAENIMLLEPGKSGGEQGLIDFQDALVGHKAYDLVSLLQDARRDVSTELEAAMLDRYRQAAAPDDYFEDDYARLGAQRNAKIVGIFTRLFKRDAKPRYLTMIPRVWEAMERDLQHEALAPVAEWFAANIPDDIRVNHGGKIA
ncbi:aminoglycoside phosphotransferase family protein [Qipengyuania seohaensis]|uniref:aminoglycoside phosphotransferase family protein n=1 Tax=Qipengyuania seohaensis TaxID=266951 RepID=UPI000C229BF8|nr:phosphotransferase [Qipengyuania seohaensis]